MPSAPPRACHCGRLRPCPVHPPRPAWDGRARPSRHARGYGADFQRNRAIVLREESCCARCGGPGRADDEAGHKLPRSEGGTSERSNLQREHRTCNATANAQRVAERRRARP